MIAFLMRPVSISSTCAAIAVGVSSTENSRLSVRWTVVVLDSVSTKYDVFAVEQNISALVNSVQFDQWHMSSHSGVYAKVFKSCVDGGEANRKRPAINGAPVQDLNL